MLTTTLAIRAVLALLLSAASFTALLRDPAAAVAPAPSPPVTAADAARSPAGRSAADVDLAYAIVDAPDSAARVCR